MEERVPSSQDTRFVGSIPEIYDRYLGPMLFVPYAEDLAARLHLPSRAPAVLELAAGTGILTKCLYDRLPHDAALVVTDLNEPMLAVAQRKLPATGSGPDVIWQMADGTALPFADSRFDAVVCQFGVMFFPDKGAGAREAYRVLRPGGQWLFNVWGSLDANPFARIAHDTIARFFPDDPPGFLPIPFSMNSESELRALVHSAGFADPEVTTLDIAVTAPSAERAAIGLVRGNPTATAIEERGTVPIDEIVRAVREALAAELGDSPMRSPARVLAVSARKPGAS